MPQIFDNIELKLLEGLRVILRDATACSFCVGYLNLRGWGQLADLVEGLPGGDEAQACRLLVGMHRPPEEEMKVLAGFKRVRETLDGPTLAQLKRRITEGFKEQLEFGVPANEDEFFAVVFDEFGGSRPGFLERYNFTIAESTPLDVEVAVDPEMIGKVYESLVNITFEGLTEEDLRGTAGIFYTPRVEIDLMCRLSLADALANHLGADTGVCPYDLVFATDPTDKDAADRALADPGRLWQRNYYEHIIRNEGDLDAIRRYIACNPLRWHLDRENVLATGTDPSETEWFG